jgi:hypothetical protein
LNPIFLVLHAAMFSAAVAQSTPPEDSGSAPLARSPHAWAVDASANEVLLLEHPDSYLRYRYHVVDEKGDQTRDQIETPQGAVARLILRDGHPLTSEADAAERERLNSILQSPAAYARHIKHEQENKKMGARLMHELPDAFLWTYTEGQPQLPDWPAASGALVVLDFKPNPKWSPPDIESEPLTGLEGRVWIDPHSRYAVHLEATLTHAVNIGWGMVAHLYPGGTAKVDQTSASGQRWIVSHAVEQLSLRALMLKSINQRLQFDTSDYQPVKPMPVPEAVKLLLDTPLPQH